MKVLILCNDYPPLNTIAAERPLGWVNHLPGQGIELVLVTKEWNNMSTDPRYWLFGDAKDIKTELHHGVTMIKVVNRMNPTDWIIRKSGWKKFSGLRRIFTFVWNLGSFYHDVFDRHSFLYSAAAGYLKNNRVDLILVTGNPWQNFRHGHRLSKKFGIPWMADYRDGWYLNHITQNYTGILAKFVRQFEWRRERKFLSNVSAITTPIPVIADFYRFLLRKPAYTVFNGYRDLPQNMPDVHGPCKILMVHNGTLTSGQQIEFLLDALLLLHRSGAIKPGDIELRMVGLHYYPAQVQRVSNHHKELLPYLVFTDRLPREESMAQIQSADFLVALSDPFFENLYAKVIEYIPVKKPILVIPDDHGIMSALVHDLGQGKAFDEVDALADYLRVSIINGTSHAQGNFNEKAASFYSRKHQAAVMAGVLKKVMKKYHSEQPQSGKQVP